MNLGGYDKNSFQESDGNRILSDILEKNKRFKTHFSELDKGPNFDGYFEFCRADGAKFIPIGRCEVQIKTMSTTYENSNKQGRRSDYKYVCETKVFNAVKEGITLNPVILFLVDVVNQKVFYIHVTFEYVLGLSIDKEARTTVYFNERDGLIEEDFYQTISDIYSNFKQKQFDKSSLTTTFSDGIDQATRIRLQEMIDKFNNAFDNELLFIKNHLFSDVWKFGIAYIENDGDFCRLGIYRVLKGEDDTLVRQFTIQDEKASVFESYYRKSMKSADDIITEQIIEIIDRYFNDAYLKPEVLPTVILEEVAFHFLDMVARYCKDFESPAKPCVFKDDLVPLSTLSSFWNALIEYTIAIYEPIVGEKGFEQGAVYDFDPFGSMKAGYDLKKKRELFDKVCNHPAGKITTDVALRFSGDFEYGFTKAVLDELYRRGCPSVRRVWRPNNYKAAVRELEEVDCEKEPYVETGYTKADMKENLLKLFRILPDCYAHTGEALFGKKYLAMSLKQKNFIGFADDLLFSYSCAIVPASNFEIELDYRLVKTGSVNSFEVVDKLYPGAIMARRGMLYRSFNGSFPLYQNLSSLIQFSICKYMGYQLPSRKVTNKAIFV